MSSLESNTIDASAKPGEILVHHDSLKEEVKKLRLFANGKLGNRNQRGMLIWGPTGSGKTTLISTAFPFIGAQFKAIKAGREPVLFTQDAEGKNKAEVLCVSAPDQSTTKGIYTSILQHLSVPTRGTQFEQKEQVIGYLRDLGTKLLIIEETQQITRSSTHKVADTFKAAIDDLPCRTVLVGLTEIQRLMAKNYQLEYRVINPIILEPFDWRVKGQKEGFLKVLRTLKSEHKQLFSSIDLAASPAAECLHIICGGLLGSLTSFLSSAVDIAAAHDRDHVLLSDLEKASADRKKAWPKFKDPFQDILPTSWAPASMLAGSDETGPEKA